MADDSQQPAADSGDSSGQDAAPPSEPPVMKAAPPELVAENHLPPVMKATPPERTLRHIGIDAARRDISSEPASKQVPDSSGTAEE